MNERVLLADLTAAIAPTVPLHHATRMWTSHHRRRDDTLGPVDVMRAATIRNDLSHYSLTWDENGESFVPVPKSCPHCGQAFVAASTTRTCSKKCAAQRRWIEDRRNRVAQPTTVSFVTILRKLRRIEMEVVELRMLLEGGRANGRDPTAGDHHVEEDMVGLA